MPLVWMSRLLGFPNVSRVYGPDLMRAITAVSLGTGYRHFYFGGRPDFGTPTKYPDAQLSGIAGRRHFIASIWRDHRRQRRGNGSAIRAARPDIVWVGLGTPKQERWMAAHVDRLEVPVLVGVGAAFDFLSGEKRQAPVWIQRSGFEWLFRLMCEPGVCWAGIC